MPIVPTARAKATLFVTLALLAALSQAVWLGSTAQRDIHTLDHDQFTAYLDARIPQLMRRYAIPGASVLLVHQGEPAWSQAYGYADTATGRRLTVDTTMKMQSISKSVTAWGVMRLAQQGVIDLDEPVSRYTGSWQLPQSRFDSEGVTARRLLSHSAGLPLGTIGLHYAPDDTIPPLTDSLRGDQARLIREPGTGYGYSNSGYALLELLIEQVTGIDFADYMSDRVLRPLGMHHSGFRWNPAWQGDVPLGYDLYGRPVEPYLYPNRASGGLFSTIEDIGRFVAAGHGADGGNAVLTPQSLEQVFTPHVANPGIYRAVADSYGLGHFVETLGDGRRAVFHGGQGLGWMTHFHFVPQTGEGIVILTNSQRSWPFFALILDDWARRGGFSPVGMSRITTATAVVRTLIGWILLVSAWLLVQIIAGVVTGKRRPSRLRAGRRARRVVEAGASAGILTALLWAVTRDYLFISSLFPLNAVRLAVSLLVLAVVLLASTLLPRLPAQSAQPAQPTLPPRHVEDSATRPPRR